MNPLWQACADYAIAHETPWPRDPKAEPAPGQQPFGVHHGDPAPYNVARGPLHPRGGVSGSVWQAGREIAAWGEPDRADQTFSVAKTALALLAGLAHTRGLLPDVDATVVSQLPGIGFDSEHNRAVTWRHLLEQTSEWEGSCFGLPDQVDRWRTVAHDPRPAGGPKGGPRPLQAPGSYWEYNDVRINQLSLALLHLFGEPLPEVFARELMLPLGASSSWRWEGYDDAWLELKGRRVNSVPGGTHWGAGLQISARDLARMGQLVLSGGRAGEQQLIGADWIRQMQQPTALAPFYGWLMWLNGDGHAFPGASTKASFMVGAGGHYVWVEPAFDAVVVVRWLDGAHASGFMQHAQAALAAG
jgi:CubicO group peptidase (beta-lactamase class C family)